MANAQSQDVERLLEQIDELRERVEARGETGRIMLAVMEPGHQATLQELPKDAQGQFDPAGWDQLSPGRQDALRNQLTTIREILERASVEPSEPSNIMFRQHASNFWIVGLTLLGLLFTITVLGGVFTYWSDATMVNREAQPPQQPSERQVLGMIILMGALGGCLHWTSSLAMFIGNAQFLRRWIPYYILMPFEGAALATLIFLLLRVGVLAPSATTDGTSNLNLLSLYAFAGLTGLFAKQAIQMLADVFTVVFTRIRAKDRAEPGREGT